MGWLNCFCGEIIKDVSQTDSENHWGMIISNGEMIAVEDKISSTILDYLVSKEKTGGRQWLDNYFHKDYPNDISLSEIINDIITVCFNEVGRSYASCSKCGALMVQTRRERSEYRPYIPVEDN